MKTKSIPMTAGLNSGWGNNIAFLHIISSSHIWIFACSEMKACLQRGGPEGWKCRAQLRFWSASLTWQPGWRPEPTARLGALLGLVEHYGSLGMLPCFSWGYGISAVYSRLQIIHWSCETKLLFTCLSTLVVSWSQTWQGLACMAFASQPFHFLFPIQDLPYKTRNGLFCCMLCRKSSLLFF